MKAKAKGRERFTLTVDESHAGQRLDHVLAELTGLSRSRVQQLLRQGRVHGPVPVPKASDKALPGACYRMELPPPAPLQLVPEAIPLDVLYEDEHLIVVNKPAGMVVHPGAGHAAGTLVHALLHHCPSLPGINGVERPGIVHRLDKDTSGGVVVAKTEQAQRALVDMFSHHDIERQYVAWCRGNPSWSEERIEAPIGRHPRQRKKMGVNAHGRAAVTIAKVERRYGDLCRLRLTLHTGRTHQIRVHLSHLHLPVLADSTYARPYHAGRDVPQPARDAINALARQALHAEVLGFIHPVTGQPIRCLAPWPEDLRQLSDALEASYG